MTKGFDAEDLARSAALGDAEKPSQVGNFISVEFDDEDRVASYLFDADIQGYKGWRWCVTVAKVDASAQPTVCDVVVLPGPDSLMAPEWIEYKDRILPEDIQPGVIVPSVLDDTRLAPGANALIQDEDLDEIFIHFEDMQLITIADAGHWVHAEQPNELLSAIKSFLAV